MKTIRELLNEVKQGKEEEVKGGIVCPRCKREAVGWPLRRRDLCSPKYWAKCIRQPEDIMKPTFDGQRLSRYGEADIYV